MKIAAVVTSLLGFVLPSTLATSLRSQGPVQKETLAKAQFIIHGVIHDFSTQDLAIIGESAIAAYDEFNKESTFKLKSLEPSLHFGVGANANWPCMHCPPDDDSFVNWPCMHCPPDDDSFAFGSEKVLLADLKIGAEWPCMHCPPDDDAVVLSTSSNHEAFVKSFCSRLTRSGSANLANAHHCSISFVEDPGHKVAPLGMSRNADNTAQGFLSMTGLKHDLSKQDIAIIKRKVAKTYNEAFAKSGLSIDAIETRGVITTPEMSDVKQCINCPTEENKLAWPCMHCPPDDDALTATVGNVLLLDVEVDAKWPCMHCPPDDDSFQQQLSSGAKWPCMHCPPDDDSAQQQQQQLSSVELEKINQAFSQKLCSKLRESGSANLATVDDCAFNYFLEHSASKA